MEELKPCPFCGGDARVCEYESFRDIYDEHSFGYVDTEYFTVFGCECKSCHCLMAEFKSEEEAIEAWNRRVSE